MASANALAARPTAPLRRLSLFHQLLAQAGDGSERGEGHGMSRRLWAELGGVALLAIAAVFWVASNQTDVTLQVSPTPVAPAPAPTPSAQKVAPSPPPVASAPAAHVSPFAPTPTAPALAPDAVQRAASPIEPSAVAPSAPPAVVKEPPPPAAPAPTAEAPLPPPAPAREAPPEVQGVYAPKSVAQLVGAWAYSAGDCERLFQRRGGGWAYRQPVDKFAQAAIVESPKRIVLPSAICRIDGASEVDGSLKVNADCEDSISFTPRSVMIALRSATELIYSASGDPALATTLKKCAP